MPVDELPEGKLRQSKKFTIAHSESGHNHVIVSTKPFKVMGDVEKHDLYVRLFEPTEVVHQKTFDIHETQVLAPGNYAVLHKTEYDPFAEVVGRVRD